MNGQTTTPNVVIVGRPNVGKSALFNRLAGRKIAIVHGQPGITRDRLSALCTRGLRAFTLWDTAGIFGAGESELTGTVHQAAQRALAESDVFLFVVDAKQGQSPMDNELARALRRARKPVILVINKIDVEKHEPLAGDFDSLGFSRSVTISAEHNRGISELIEQIEILLPPTTDRPLDGESRVEDILRIAVLGRPNVGKSSLINAIMRDQRAMVSELPGTTRDAIDISYERSGHHFVFIDTAGIRRRSKHSSSVEVFSVMRAEKSVRRADLCVLAVDVTSGVTAQDKRIAGLIQKADKAAIVAVNKWDLAKPSRKQKEALDKVVDVTRDRIFFADYAPVLVSSARTGENVDKIFTLITKIQIGAKKRIGTGVLNRSLRAAFAAHPPPMRKGKRLKLFYAAQAAGREDRRLHPPEFVLFVNDPGLFAPEYGRYLEARVRKIEPYPGLPILLTLRPRREKL